MRSATDIIHNSALRSHLEAQAQEMVMNAYRQQGPRAVLATRRCAAVHEAGHAIVYHRTASRRSCTRLHCTIGELFPSDSARQA